MVKHQKSKKTSTPAPGRGKQPLCIISLLCGAASLGAAILCFALFFNVPPSYTFQVGPGTGGKQSVSVTLTVKASWFCRVKNVPLYVGSKDIRFVSCKDAKNHPQSTATDNGLLAVPVSRGGSTVLTYYANLADAGKHGLQGYAGANYTVFSGDEVLLLPQAYYSMDEKSLRKTMGAIELKFSFPVSWRKIIPRNVIKAPGWSSLYNLTQDAFAFGDFEDLIGGKDKDGLHVYLLKNNKKTDAEAFEKLYAYYTGLFHSEPHSYRIVLLPGSGTDTGVIGGAGTDTVASTFDPASLRDWQLLAHRMFHAFFDSAAPSAALHTAPNLWFYEGLATYYENVSMGALPEPLRKKLNVNVNREFTLLFNRYLYMRIKDPFTYGFAPMEEDKLTSAGMTEFLHYTAAPLIVKELEDTSAARGNPPDALLKFCVKSASHTASGSFATAAVNSLLAGSAPGFLSDYMQNPGIPPLWNLKSYEPSSVDILNGLNDMETTMGSWFQLENDKYPVDLATQSQLQKAVSAAKKSSVSFLPADVSIRLQDYSFYIYALLNDYYTRAQQKGLSFNDPNLRFELLNQS